MAYRAGFRIVEVLPVVLKIWKELSSRDSTLGNCVSLLSKLDLPCRPHSAAEAVATEWVNTLPVILQLCEKVPAQADAIRRYIKTLPVLMQISRNLPQPGSVFVQQFQEPSMQSVIREDYLVDISRGKRVLHFGFLDSPFSEDRIRSGELLHLKLKNVASELYGIDSDQASLDRYRQLTGDKDNAAADIQKEIQGEVESRWYDIVLLPEIMEHLGNPARALANMKQICLKRRETQLCVTVPNAYYAGVFLRALEGEEIVHPEHYYYFSPATLRRLLVDAGFTIVDMALYGSRDTSALPGITKNGVIAMCRVS